MSLLRCSFIQYLIQQQKYLETVPIDEHHVEHQKKECLNTSGLTNNKHVIKDIIQMPLEH